MPAPFSVSCPNCSATLKIRDKSKLGKKARCPKCNKPFVLKVDEPDEDEFLSDLVEDYEDEFEDDDEFDDAPSSRSSRSLPSSSGGASSKSKKSPATHEGNSLLVGIMGGTVLGIVLLVLVISLMSGPDDAPVAVAVNNEKPEVVVIPDASPLAFIPSSSELIVRIDFDELRKNPAIKQQLAALDNIEQAQELIGASSFKLADVASVTVGISSLSSMMTPSVPNQPLGMPDMLAVLKFKRDITLDEILKSNSDLSPYSYQGKQFADATKGTNKIRSYVVDPRTVLTGSENRVMAAIAQIGKKQDHSAFEFIDWSSPIALGFAPKKPRDVFGKVNPETPPPEMPPAIVSLAKEFGTKARAVGLMIKVQKMLDLNIALKFTDSTSPATVKTSLESLVEMGKQQLETIKNGPLMAMAPDSDELMKSAETALAGLAFKPDGNLLTVALSTDLPEFNQSENTPTAASSFTAPLMNMFTQSFGQARQAGMNVMAKNRMKQIGLAMHNYHEVHKKFPDAAINDESGKPLLSWRVSLLPYLGEDELYKQFHLNEPWNSPHNMALLQQMPEVFSHEQTDALPGKTLYRLLQFPGSIFDSGKGVSMKDITDGTSNTILVTQSGLNSVVEWTKPDGFGGNVNALYTLLLVIQSDQGGYIQLLFADGSVRKLYLNGPQATSKNLKSAMTRNGGEVIPPVFVP